MQNKIDINVFFYKNKVVYPVYLSERDATIDLLLISNGFLSHYVYIKYLTDLCLIKQNAKEQILLRKCCLQCFSGRSALIEHKKDCLLINGKQKC